VRNASGFPTITFLSSKAAPSTSAAADRGAASREKEHHRRKGKAIPHSEAAEPPARCGFTNNPGWRSAAATLAGDTPLSRG